MAASVSLASLRAVPLLAALPEERLRALGDRAAPRRHPAGRVLRHAGEPATHLLCLLSGRVAATATTAGGRVLRFGEFAAPCALDKVALIDGRGHTATLTAVTPCVVLPVPRAEFLAMAEDVPAVRGHVLRVLAAGARRQQERFAATATLPVVARLAAWLLAEAGADGRVGLPGGQQGVADLLGTTRVTVNRALSRLRREGLVATERGAVRVLAPELLALRAGRP
ncbi:Crp/Fnr family transcriptional regulator [Streptomyces hoynatensis]|uniref:Crp/Fnr family transcriptional regulator n=1 Tax=Streptomyces hoynatensis TaxID=1141874 RepID=A0A3A9Z457_9ACTN|nr:Crp/Fnr family transcriptional regulator [Streptomyces hoynatensis]RKN43201.1 Crp/Fnr family transcriptional regulator [Streptomyces hoynatensis]